MKRGGWVVGRGKGGLGVYNHGQSGQSVPVAYFPHILHSGIQIVDSCKSSHHGGKRVWIGFRGW